MLMLNSLLPSCQDEFGALNFVFEIFGLKE